MNWEWTNMNLSTQHFVVPCYNFNVEIGSMSQRFLSSIIWSGAASAYVICVSKLWLFSATSRTCLHFIRLLPLCAASTLCREWGFQCYHQIVNIFTFRVYFVDFSIIYKERFSNESLNPKTVIASFTFKPLNLQYQNSRKFIFVQLFFFRK